MSSSSGTTQTPLFGEEDQFMASGAPGEDLNDFISSLLINDSDSSSSSSSSSSSTSSGSVGEVKTVLAKMTLSGLSKDVKEGKHTQASRESFGAFLPKEGDAPGFALSYNEIKVAPYITKAINGQVSRHCSLSAPAVSGRNIAVGLYEDKSADYFLACVNADTMGRNPLLAFCRTLEAPRYPTWQTPSRLTCCSVSGALNVFTFSSEKKQLTHLVRITGVHSKEVRELAVCPTQRNLLASTGADGLLCLTDTETHTILVRTSLGAIGGSVKWTGYSDALGLTLDSGSLLLFDTRTNLSKPARSIATNVKTPLYTHARYGEHNALLGFANGHIHNVDLRNGARVGTVEDPYVEGIGQIEMKGDAFVTSGFYDFSVWRANGEETNIWSHSSSSVRQYLEGADVTYCATFLNEDEVLATNSLGYMGIWRQGFGGGGHDDF